MQNSSKKKRKKINPKKKEINNCCGFVKTAINANARISISSNQVAAACLLNFQFENFPDNDYDRALTEC